jgi:XisH protein
MPAKDKYHDALRSALVKDGWTITDDPLRLVWGKRDFYVDLGAERIVAAEKAGKRIAVEVKSFLSNSQMHDLELALGQFLLYRSILEMQEPDRLLFLAVPDEPAEILDEPIGQLLVGKHLIQALVFDPEKEEICDGFPEPISPGCRKCPHNLYQNSLC